MKIWILSIFSSNKAGSQSAPLRVQVALLAGRYLLLLALLLVAIDQFTTRMVLSNPTSDTWKVQHLISDTTTNEIPIFGASFAQVNYFPDSLGPQFYTYGIPSSNFQKIELLIALELAKDKEGPLIIDFFNGFLKERGAAALPMQTYLPLIRNPQVAAFAQKHGRLKPYHQLPGIRYAGHYLHYFTDYLSKDVNYPTLRARGGHFFCPATPPKVMARAVAKQRNKKGLFLRYPESENAFVNLIEQHPNRTFVLVVSPYHSSVYKQQIDLPAISNYLHTLKRFANVRVLIFDGKDYPDSLFRDPKHLNLAGAKRFSVELRNELQQLGIPSR